MSARAVTFDMSIYWTTAATVVIAQLACVADMVLRGETLPMRLAGGAPRIRKSESVIGFYVLLVIWVILFVGIDLLIFFSTALVSE